MTEQRAQDLQTELLSVSLRVEALMSDFENAADPGAVANVSDLLANLERRVATCRSFLLAQASGATVRAFTPVDGTAAGFDIDQATDHELDEVDQVDQAELAAAQPAQFRLAKVAGESFDGVTAVDEGSGEFYWVGSRCIVRR
jgi:hypothetical protein